MSNTPANVIIKVYRLLCSAWAAIRRWFLNRWLYWLVQKPLFATGITLLIILAGGMFGIFADDIKHAWPFTISVSEKWKHPALYSWLIAVTAAFLFFFRQQSDDQKREDVQQQSEGHAAQLERAQQSLAN